MDEKQAPTPASHARFDEEAPQGFLRTALQFVAIPLVIVGVAVGLYVGISLIVGTGPTTAADFVRLGSIRPDQGSCHSQSGRKFSRSDDCSDRRRTAPEDA